MKTDYRNEYYYKNTLLNKLLIGKHSVNTTSALTEVNINKSKADFVLINGKAVVYEIKTELDNLDRLECQIMDYYTRFESCLQIISTHYKIKHLFLSDNTIYVNFICFVYVSLTIV